VNGCAIAAAMRSRAIPVTTLVALRGMGPRAAGDVLGIHAQQRPGISLKVSTWIAWGAGM
jgi:hypothetical protein